MDIRDIAIGLLLAFWVYISSVFLTTYVASQKGRSGLGWFFLSFLFPPYMTLLALAALPEKKEEEWLERVIPSQPTDPTIGQRLGRS